MYIPLSAREEHPRLNELILKFRNGDEKAKEELFKHYRYIIENVCARYRHLSFDYSAKRYGAIMGLYHAFQKYNLKSRFAYYAYECACGMVKREISSTEYPIHRPAHILEKAIKNGEWLKIVSIPDDMALFDDDDPDAVPHEAPYEELMSRFDTDKIDRLDVFKKAIECLTEREKDAIEHIMGREDKTLEEYGEKHKLTRERIRQIEIVALAKLRKFAQRKHLAFNDFY